MSDNESKPDPCEYCAPRILKLAPDEYWECPECGVEWYSDERGVQLADEN